LRFILSITLALLILLNSLGRVFIVLEYQLNKDYIAKILCINRDKPQLACNGKCHLKKQLQKAEEQEKKTANSAEGKSEMPWLCYMASFSLQTPVFKLIPTIVGVYLMAHTTAHPFGIFQPPQF
jgi:hypothetical protein